MSANGTKYGALYNWHAVSQRNLCPTGWHVATKDDWSALITYAGGYSFAGKVKEAGTANWVTPNAGAANQWGFKALPGGGRIYTGPFYADTKYEGYWWSSTQKDATSAYAYNMNYSASSVSQTYATFGNGFSVRCVKD